MQRTQEECGVKGIYRMCVHKIGEMEPIKILDILIGITNCESGHKRTFPPPPHHFSLINV